MYRSFELPCSHSHCSDCPICGFHIHSDRYGGHRHSFVPQMIPCWVCSTCKNSHTWTIIPLLSRVCLSWAAFRQNKIHQFKIYTVLGLNCQIFPLPIFCDLHSLHPTVLLELQLGCIDYYCIVTCMHWVDACSMVMHPAVRVHKAPATTEASAL